MGTYIMLCNEAMTVDIGNGIMGSPLVFQLLSFCLFKSYRFIFWKNQYIIIICASIAIVKDDSYIRTIAEITVLDTIYIGDTHS